MATTQPIRNKMQVRELANHYLKRGKLRNYVLIILCVNTSLRISDLLRLSWEDLFDFKHKRALKHISIIEKKTGKSKTIALNASAAGAINLFAADNAKFGHALIENTKTGKAISRVQAYRIIRDAAEAVDIEMRVSCHSLRKTFGYHSWKKGVPLAILMVIYNHSSLAITLSYLGIMQDDIDAVYLGLDLT